MNIIADILNAIDGATGTNQHNGTHTFTVAAPLCIPIRELWSAMYGVGIRGKFQEMPSVLTFQTARITVSNRQAKYASLLLWKQAMVWPEGLNIKNDPWRKKSLAAIGRNGYKMPEPWKDKSKPWKQTGCKTQKPRR